MEDHYLSVLSDEERAALRAKRAERRRKKLQEQRRRRLQVLAPSAAVLVLLSGLLLGSGLAGTTESRPEMPEQPEPLAAQPARAAVPESPFTVSPTAETLSLGDGYYSEYAVLIDPADGTILARKNADAVINPASMTKVLTVLVAAEQDPRLDDTFTITREITDYCYTNGCSVVGLDVDETVSVRELFYGTILPSGADAALALAMYTSGSQEAFVALMNDKLEELGLSDTAHFTNCVGLYDEAHKCTVTDMALIMKAAMDNDLCRQVLSAHTYETAPTTAHPEGQTLSNWFLRRIVDHDTEQSVRAVGAKTGYVAQSGNCAVSWGEDAAGNAYVCATGKAGSSWQAIYDHVALYQLCGRPADGTAAVTPAATAPEGAPITPEQPAVPDETQPA